MPSNCARSLPSVFKSQYQQFLRKQFQKMVWVSAQAFVTWFFTDSFELLAEWLDLSNLMPSAQLPKHPSLLSASNFASHKLLKSFAAPLLKWFTAAFLEKPSNCLQAPQRSSLKASAQEIDPTGKFPESSSLTGLQWYHKHQTLQYFFSLQIGTCQIPVVLSVTTNSFQITYTIIGTENFSWFKSIRMDTHDPIVKRIDSRSYNISANK